MSVELKYKEEVCRDQDLDFRQYVKDMLAEQEYAKLHPTKFVAGSTGAEKVWSILVGCCSNG